MIQQSIQFCHACGSRAAPRALYCVDCGARLAPTGRHARSPRPAGVRVGGRYRLRRLIDMGGNGAVYEAQHELLGTTHALKESLANDQPSLEQFLSEARLMARLDHPVLVQVSDYFVEPSGAAFLVMDYVSGETLQHKLEQPVASYSVSDVISWLLQLCSALEYLHDYRDPATGQLRPVIHRDVKPLNIVVTAEGRVKLLDLGIARFAVPGEATARIARAVTEPFAPIEQYGAGTDARSDLYALGVTAYVMLTRQLPPSALERATQPLDLRVRAINREVPPAVAAAIERAMMPRADARYPSVEAFRHAIESGWVSEDRLDELAGGARGRETSGLWGVLRRALVGPGEAGGPAARIPPAPGEGFRLAERLVEWRSRADGNAALDITLALERGHQGPAQLRLQRPDQPARPARQALAPADCAGGRGRARLRRAAGRAAAPELAHDRRAALRGRADDAARHLAGRARAAHADDPHQRPARRPESMRDHPRSSPGRVAGGRASVRAAAGAERPRNFLTRRCRDKMTR